MARSVICDCGMVVDINMDGVTIMRTPSCKLHLSELVVVLVVVVVVVETIVGGISID